jgi:hypothetical protein
MGLDILLSVVFSMLNIPFPKFVDTGLGAVSLFAYALMSNYAYYLKEMKGEQGWNPFKGMRW